MKKLIVILAVMIAFVGAVFAATGDTLTITANVAKIDPIFVIKGQLTATGETDNTQKTANATLASVKDISQESIPVSITIAQYNNTKSKYKGTLTLTITPTELAKTIDSVEYKTALPAYSDGELKNVNGIGNANIQPITHNHV